MKEHTHGCARGHESIVLRDTAYVQSIRIKRGGTTCITSMHVLFAPGPALKIEISDIDNQLIMNDNNEELSSA